MKAGEIKKLTKAMGAPYLDLIPPDQHKWQMDKGEPPIHRMWSWLCSHTIHWNGQERSAWAIDKENNDLFIEHLAKDVFGDGAGNLANARTYWQEGKARGLWRNGTKEEGKRRLYLCGEVTPAQPELPADPEKSMYILIPDQILKKTKGWPAEKLESFRVWYSGWAPTRKEVRDTSIAELVGVARGILDRDDDTALLAEWGIPPNRQEHKNGKSQEEAEASQARVAAIAASVDKYVHTVSEFVQAHKNGGYKQPVQAENGSATLLSSENSQRGPERAVVHSETAQQSRSSSFPDDGKKLFKQVPVPETLVSAPRGQKTRTPSTAEEKEAVEILFTEIERMQVYFKHTDFSSSPVSRESASDQIMMLRVAHAAGPDNMTEFLLEVRGMFKGLDKNAMGKLPPRAPGHPNGPRSLGLILKWAEDFGRRHGIVTVEATNGKSHGKEIDRQAIHGAIQELKDPTATDSTRQLARETLEANGIQYGVEVGARP